jgi:hypothetical protein
MARKIGTRKNRRYGKHGGFLGFGEGSKSGRSWTQYFGFAPETPTTAQYLGVAKQPEASIPETLGVARQQSLSSDIGLRGGQRRMHFSSRAGRRMRKSRGTRKSKKTRKHRK